MTSGEIVSLVLVSQNLWWRILRVLNRSIVSGWTEFVSAINSEGAGARVTIETVFDPIRFQFTNISRLEGHKKIVLFYSGGTFYPLQDGEQFKGAREAVARARQLAGMIHYQTAAHIEPEIVPPTQPAWLWQIINDPHLTRIMARTDYERHLHLAR